MNSEKWEIKLGRREIFAQPCQESCESYVRALRKKLQCLICLLKNSSWGQSGQWQGVATAKLGGGKDLQLEWRKVRGQTKEIRRGNPQDLGIDWVDCEVAGVVEVDKCRDGEIREGDREQEEDAGAGSPLRPNSGQVPQG